MDIYYPTGRKKNIDLDSSIRGQNNYDSIRQFENNAILLNPLQNPNNTTNITSNIDVLVNINKIHEFIIFYSWCSLNKNKINKIKIH